jgi:hypothetical protein
MITLLDGVHRSQTGCRIRGQITEGTLLDKLTMFKHNNPVRVLQCADAMGNDEHRPVILPIVCADQGNPSQ